MFLCPFGWYCSACFGILFVSILCTCCSHFSWYCFISFTMFCAPVFFPNTLISGNLIGFVLQFVLVKFIYWAFAMNVRTNCGWQVLCFLVLSTWCIVVSLSAFPWGETYTYSEGCCMNISHSGDGDEYKDFFQLLCLESNLSHSICNQSLYVPPLLREYKLWCNLIKKL